MNDFESSGVPFEHGFELRLQLEPERPFPAAIASLAESLGQLAAGGELRLLALQEPGDHETELRRLGLLRFWEEPANRSQTLVLFRFEFRASTRTSADLPAALASVRLRANSRAAIDIAIAADRLQPRKLTLERLARSLRLPHQIDRPMGPGELCRFEADASLLLSYSTGERLGIAVGRPGSGGASLERNVSIRGGLRVGASAGSRIRWDMRAGSIPHALRLQIQHANEQELEGSVTADAVASLAVRGLPDRTAEILEALLDGETDDPAAAAEEIVEAVPEIVEELDDLLARATRVRLRAALEAALSMATSEKLLLEAEIDLDRVHALTAVRRLGSGDISPLFEKHDAILSLKGSLRDELRRRTTLQLTLSSPSGALRRMKRSEIRTALERRLRLDEDGVIHVDLQVTGSAEAERERWGESLETLFQVALTGDGSIEGESGPLTLRTLRWNIVMRDENGSDDDLARCIALVEALGFRSVNGWQELRAVPADSTGALGKLQLSLDLRIDPAGIAERLRSGDFESTLREAMRRAYLLAQLAKPGRQMLDLAWAYWTRDSAARWNDLRRRSIDSFVVSETVRIEPVRQSPILSIRAPERVELSRSHRALLDRLYTLEERVVESLTTLAALARSGGAGGETARAMQSFIAAVRGFDAADAAPETIYYVLDALLPSERRRPAQLLVTATSDHERWRTRIPLQRTEIKS